MYVLLGKHIKKLEVF